MALRPTIGHIRPDSERAAWWREVYGSLEVPLVSPVPELGYKPDGLLAQFFRVDVSKLTEEQLERAARFLAEKFGEPVESVREGILGDHGIPVLAEDVSVTFDARRVL